ncbi:hypothetical protein [Salicola sp. Rm-C-2C1-2]|uniref:hypothetical protein n=1 Tax=Salicola sp. Rm-C-2C1-2 TaxID=3141321 RepID=UPI0032E50DCB
MFRNFHFIVALLVAPALAILAWYAADTMLSDKKEKAKEGLGYELIGESNCRYESGTCTMSNGNFKLDIQVDRAGEGKLAVRLESAHPLDAMSMGWVNPDADSTKQTMLEAVNEKATRWQGVIPGEASTKARMRVLARADGTSYYGDAKTVFIDYETSFGEDFRK